MIHQPGDQRADQQPKGGGGKGAQRKALQHFVNGNQQRAKAETNDESQIPILNQLKLGRLAHGITADGAHRQKEDTNSPERHIYLNGYRLDDVVFGSLGL